MNGDSKEGRGRVIVPKGLQTPGVHSETSELSMLMNEEKVLQRSIHGKPYEGKLHVRFDEGTVET